MEEYEGLQCPIHVGSGRQLLTTLPRLGDLCMDVNLVSK